MPIFYGIYSLPAILFIDSCSSHLDNDLLELLAKYLKLFITYPSHSSHIFQVLDLLLIGVLKIKKKKTIPKNDQISPKVDYLYRIYLSSFMKAGSSYYLKDGKNYLKLNKSKIENSPNFKEVWNINYLEAKLSPRRRNQKKRMD